jgi:type I restriction enzyme S subunit
MSSKGAGTVTTLRFPEFLGKPLHDVCLGDVTEEATARNGNKLARALVMGVRKEGGIVPMEERLVAGDIARYKNVQKSWFAYNPMRLNIGSIAQWQGDEEVLVSPDYVVFRCNPGSLLPEYLDHFRSSRQWEAFTNESGDGGVRIRIYYRDIARMRLMLPDISEQKKIADCLSSIDALIAAEAEKLEALKDHKEGLMQQLFPAPGETTPRLRFPEFQSAGDWKERLLGEICEVAQGYGFPEALQGKPRGDFPFCKVSDISRAVSDQGGVLDSAVNYVHLSDLKILRAKTIPAGATVFAKIGEALRLNRRAISGVECLIDNNSVALKAKSGVASDYFVFLLSQMIDMNEHCGGAVPSVNKSTLEGIGVIIPQPKEQQKIAEYFSSCNAIIALQANKIDALKAHKSGLMQQLFPASAKASA